MDHSEQIPRIIHYCWFGRGKKSNQIKKCMQSWREYLGNYEWIEWNEERFDVYSNLYAKQAYNAEKYAFVSDYVRLYALYHYGGIYLDTDVEIIKPLNQFLFHEAFTGFEDGHYLQSGTMGAMEGHPWIKSLMDDYAHRSFILDKGEMDLTTNTAKMTLEAQRQGLRLNDSFQILNGVAFYPRTYFSPYDYINGASYITDSSYSIHHFAKSWLPAHVRAKSQLKKIARRYVGPKFVDKMREIFK